MRWQYWAAIVFAACLVVLALDVDRVWPLGVAAVFVLFVLVTQNRRDHRRRADGGQR